MGQKVHPLGFRVGITKKHQSQWFAKFNKNKYSQSVLEDRMIRDTLSKLFPELLNPVLNSAASKKRDQNQRVVTPRITQIKIERGLIPYEIGIQIHAQNCYLLKSAIDNLKVKRELIVKLQKMRHYLLHLKLKLNDLKTKNLEAGISCPFALANEEHELTSQNDLNGVNSHQRKVSKKKRLSKKITSNGKIVKIKKSFKSRRGRRIKLTKQERKRQRLIKKRLTKRYSIRRRYRRLILKGLFIKKVGTQITKKLSLKSAIRFSRKGQKVNKLKNNRISGRPASNNIQLLTKPTRNGGSQKPISSAPTKVGGVSTAKNFVTKSGSNTFNSRLKKKFVTKSGSNTFNSRLKKKFVTLFIQKMNKKFLLHVKSLLMNHWEKTKNSNSNSLPLGYTKKWSFNHRLATLKAQPIHKLNRLATVLEQKLLVKLSFLKKEFIAFGSISSRNAQIFGFLQIATFLKKLEELIYKLKREQRLSAIKNESQKSINRTAKNTSKKDSTSNAIVSENDFKTSKKIVSSQLRVAESTDLFLFHKVIQKKLNNIGTEWRKIKFIEYLKDIVRKHRTENIYLYLPTLADAKKDLKTLKQLTKIRNLFGLNLESSNTDETSKSGALEGPQADKINERVNKVLEKLAKKVQFEKTFQETELQSIENKKNICLQNLQLTPKISIKFYSVNKKTLDKKASVVAESVVDALEKRKAFRKVIKDAKQTLMDAREVKGVKIQVAGRLNGAEIARTEWVRAGRVPLQTLRANLDYSYKTANTIYGIIGVRVWIFKGYTKLINK